MAPVLEAKSVAKIYQSGTVKYTALQEISLSVHSGDFLALCGPSGSGKTTLLNLLGTLDEPTSGDIVVAGHTVKDLSDSHLAKLRRDHFGFIFQTFNLVPVLSAAENVQLPLIKKGLAAAEIEHATKDALSQVGLQEHARHRPSQLSGGQRQRVAIARALVMKPRMILADEPTANLDHKTAREILQIMQTLNQTAKLTFVFSTHDPEIMAMAKRLIHLRDGRIQGDEVRP